MDARKLKEFRHLIAELEGDPQRMPAFYRDLESGIKALMDATFESDNAPEKTRLAALEFRARSILEQFRKANAN